MIGSAKEKIESLNHWLKEINQVPVKPACAFNLMIGTSHYVFSFATGYGKKSFFMKRAFSCFRVCIRPGHRALSIQDTKLKLNYRLINWLVLFGFLWNVRY